MLKSPACAKTESLTKQGLRRWIHALARAEIMGIGLGFSKDLLEVVRPQQIADSKTI